MAVAAVAVFGLAAPASAAVLPAPIPVVGDVHGDVHADANLHLGAHGLCRTAVTHLIARPDSGNHGTWAYDSITRTTTTCETAVLHTNVAANVALPPLADVNTQLRLNLLASYHATVVDTGTFVTVDGHSPNRGLPICRGCHGHLAGGFTADFTALAGFHGYLGVYAGNTYTGTNPTSTGNWLAGLWGVSLNFGTGDLGNLEGWSWTYWLCGDLPRVGSRAYLTALHSGRLWVDAYNNGDGTGPLAGDILNCRCVEHSPSPSPSVSVSSSPSANPSPPHSPSPSASVSPSPSDTSGGGINGGGTGGSGGSTGVVPPAAGGPVAVQPVAQGETLPKTGSPVAYLAGAAVVLVGAGGMALFLARRRRFVA